MKTQYIKIIVIATLSLLVSKGSFAQYHHEFSVYGGGGLSSLNYKPSFGNRDLRLGGHFGLGYHFFFTPKLGLGTGLELGFYNTRYNFDNLEIRYWDRDVTVADIRRADFEFRSTITDYEEKQHDMMLQIPLMLQFQTGKEHKFFAAAGGKMGFSFNGKYNYRASSIKNVAYFPFEDGLYDTQEFFGLGNFVGRKSKGNSSFKTAFFLSAEAGVKWNVNNRRSLYTGLFVDYGLNNIMKKQNLESMPHFVEYKRPYVESNRVKSDGFVVNSIVNSKFAINGNAPQVITDKMKPIAVGIKMRLTFGHCKKRTIEEREPCKEAIEEALRKAAAAAEVDTASQQPQPGTYPGMMPDAMRRLIELPIDHYALNQTEPEEYQRYRLDLKIELLQAYPDVKFHIQGHTCDIGTTEANERVGLGRDVKAKAYMISKGIDPSRILGNECQRDRMPVAPNINEPNRRLNRRVVIIIDSEQ